MTKLNLPDYSFRIRNKDKGMDIFDPVRKKFVTLTPEEWVRQNFIMYLISEKNYSPSLIAVESGLLFNKMKKRCDITVYDRKGKKWMLIECKSPEVKLTQAAFNQVATYNASGKEKVPYLAVTNGLKHYCCELSAETGNEYRFLKDFPSP